MIKSSIFIVCATLFVAGGVAHAHLEAGGEDKVVGEYLVDLGYSPGQLRVGDAAQFLFNLKENSTKANVEIENVWVRLAKGEKILFAATLSEQEFPGSASFLYEFGEGGAHELTTRFQKKGEAETVETTFPFTVAAPTKRKSRVSGASLVGFLVGGVFGGTAVYLLFPRRKV